MTRLFRAKFLAALGILCFPALGDDSPVPAGIETLEAYKRRLSQLEGAQSDPARAAQLRQMRQLLWLLQRSIALQEQKPAEADPGTAGPVPGTESAGSPPSPVPPPPPPPDAILTPSSDPSPSQPPSAAPGPQPIPAPTASAQVSPPTPAAAPPSESYPDTAPRPDPTPTPTPEIAPWFLQARLSTALGYQENLLRSAFSNLESSLLHGEVDLQLMNTRRTDNRALALGRYTRTHFLDEPSVRDEDLLFVFAQFDHRMAGAWWLGASASYFSAHQPFDDPDVIDLEGASAPLRFRQLTLSPQFSWEPNVAQRWVLQGGYRQETTDGLAFENQDNDQWFLELGYTFEPNERHRLRLDYHYTTTDYDERVARLATGERLDETLSLRQHEWEAAYRRTWLGAETRWRAESRVRLLVDADAQGGYDDLSRLEIRGLAGLRFRKRTELRAELRYGHYFYDRRQVRIDDSRIRERSYWAGGFALEHSLGDHTALWINYDFRDNSGNKSLDRYGVHTLYTGIRVTF